MDLTERPSGTPGTESNTDSVKRLLSMRKQTITPTSRYVGSSDLQGSSLKDRSLAQQWMRFTENEIVPLLCAWVYATMGMLPHSKQVFQPSFHEPYSNVNRWFGTRVHLPEFVAVLGDITLCKEARQFKEGCPMNITFPMEKNTEV
ncbi:elongation factor 1-gamma-A-like isoform X2 [Ascaphus truei]|uniref:elongation factor 1-gamma-A-like isoform X2 n=1 Tax=Ascaphus truei TaxID=8439 RepID=UPI003F5915E1